MSTQLLTDRDSQCLKVWVRLLRGHAAVRRSLSAQLQHEHELTVNDFEALLLLSRAQDSCMRRVDMADGLQLTASGVTRMLDGLEADGLVEKRICSSDGRVSYAALTEAGLKRLKQASSSHIVGIEAVFQERFTDEELATLAALLGRLPGAGGADGTDCQA